MGFPLEDVGIIIDFFRGNVKGTKVRDLVRCVYNLIDYALGVFTPGSSDFSTSAAPVDFKSMSTEDLVKHLEDYSDVDFSTSSIFTSLLLTLLTEILTRILVKS